MFKYYSLPKNAQNILYFHRNALVMISLKRETLGTLCNRTYFFWFQQIFIRQKELTYSRSVFLKKNHLSVRINIQFKKETKGIKKQEENHPD